MEIIKKKKDADLRGRFAFLFRLPALLMVAMTMDFHFSFLGARFYGHGICRFKNKITKINE